MKILFIILLIVLFALIGIFSYTNISFPKENSVNITQAPSPTSQATISTNPDIYIILMENHSYSDMYNSSNAPYINSLMKAYLSYTNYHAVAHPSLPNYIALTSGSTFNISSDCQNCFLAEDNIANEMTKNNISWKAYMENLPQPCFLGNLYPYAQKHNPFIYYDDIRENNNNCMNILPLDQFNPNNASSYSWITPNLCNDMHDCSISNGDKWLEGFVPKIINTNKFQKNGILFITWDEGEISDQRIPLIVISNHFTSGNLSEYYDHYSLLRTIEDILGLTLLGNSKNAQDIGKFTM